MMSPDPHPEIQAPAKIDIIGFLARFAPLIFLIVLMAAFAICEPRFHQTAKTSQFGRRYAPQSHLYNSRFHARKLRCRSRWRWSGLPWAA